MPYVFRVREGVYDENSDTFTQKTPANYVSDSGQYDMGQGLQQVTNTWQTFDLSAEIVWDGAPAAAYDLPDDKTATLSLYRYTGADSTQKEKLGTILLDGISYKVETALKFIGRATAEGWKVKVSALPKYNLDTGELYTYLVEQSEVLPLIYTANPPVQTGGDWVFTNTFDKKTVEVFKEYINTTSRPPVTIVLFQNGAEFDRFELDGIPHGSADSGEPYEANPGRLIWPNLPARTLEGDDAKYTVTEIIPENFPYQRVITETPYGFYISNTYNDGRFTAVKRWNIGQAPLPESVTFKLWRWVSGSGYHEKEAMPVEYDGVMDGTVDTAPGAHGSESRAWEYTWTNLPLNGNYNNDPKQPVYYTYFVEEVPLGSDYIVDAVTSSSAIIKNIALKTQFTAQKIWGGGPEPDVYFQLMQFDGTETISLGSPVLLNGEADAVSAGESGELSPWAYTWTDLPRFVDNDTSKPYTYTAKEVNADGNDFTPDGYIRYNNNSSRIINIHNSDVNAVKTWVGGDAQRAEGIGPDSYFTLYRRTIFEEEAAAMDPDHEDLGGQPVTKPVALWGSGDSPNTVTVTWEKLPWGTGDGLPYIYSVVETDSGGNPKDLWKDADDPQTYIYKTTYDENEPLKVTNTYESPTREVVAGKFWHGVAEGASLPGVWLKLWRGLTDDNQALVPAEEATAREIPGATFAEGRSSQVSWTGVLKFDAQGREYLYTTREYAAANATEPGAPEGFANTRAGLNQHNMKLTDIKATKHWKQLPENASHPEVVLQLKRAEVGSAEPAQVVDTHTMAAGTETSTQHIFKNKPIYGMNAAEEIVAYIYTVDEAAVPNGYTKQVGGNVKDGFIITNTYDGVSSDDGDDTNDHPISVKAAKAWTYPAGIAEPLDADKPVVRFNLKRNDNAMMGEKTPAYNTANPWQVVWEELHRYDTLGNAYRYEAFEVMTPDGYKASVTGSQEEGFTITNTYDGTGADGKLLDVVVSSEWQDKSGQVVVDTALLPRNLSIRLTGGNAPAEAYLLMPDADGNWSHTYRNLYAYDTRGKPIAYSVSETVPNGYKQQPTQGDQTSGFVLVNKYDGVTNNKSPADPGNPQEPVTIHVVKAWQGADGQAVTDNRKLPAGLLLTLHGGALVADEPLILTGASEWKASLTNRAKYDSTGEEIIYSLTETVPNGYTIFSQVHTKAGDEHTFSLTNTYDGVTNNADPDNPVAESVAFKVTKVWQNVPKDTDLPQSITLRLLANGLALEERILTRGDGWQTEWGKLYKYQTDSSVISYQIAEVDVPGDYRSQVKGDSVQGYTVTNTYHGVLAPKMIPGSGMLLSIGDYRE
ncbi:MAG: Cna B-type domain-containing protein [Christensenellales bacterium]